MNKEEAGKRSKLRLLSVRLPLLIVASFMVIMVIIIVSVYFRFRNQMIDEYTRMAKGVTNLMANSIDADRIDEYIEKNYALEEYNEIIGRLYELKDNYPDVMYMYVYELEDEHWKVVMDLDDEEGGEGSEPGTIYEMDDAFVPYLDVLTAGGEMPALSGKTPYGYLLTYARPVYDSEGVCRCYASVDFSMDYLYNRDMAFIFRLSVILLLSAGAVLVIILHVARKTITDPIMKMSKCTKEFTYDTEEGYSNNITLMEGLDIHTNDEIEDLYHVFVSVMKDSFSYRTNLNKANLDIKDKEAKLTHLSKAAYKDALTGVGNKAGYNKEIELLHDELADGAAEFAIVMVDVNNLKYINDTYGHEKGDIYINGCCNIVCDLCKRSPVYRIGGDEFVVILRGQDYENRHMILEEMECQFLEAYGNGEHEEWERYSASYGIAEYSPDNDSSVEAVFRRADEAMYKYKLAFKKEHGSYR